MKRDSTAVCVLTRGYPELEGYDSLKKRNESLARVFDGRVDEFDFLVWHEGNIDATARAAIQAHTPDLPLRFLDVTTTPPATAFDDRENKRDLELCPPTPLSDWFPLGYRHMCAFWSWQFLDYTRDYRYVLRVDEDCFVQELDLSLFDELREGGFVYAAGHFGPQDRAEVIVGLEVLFERFVKHRELRPYASWEEIRTPYTNLMVADVEYFRSDAVVQDFLRVVRECSCVYSNRWGDLPIWGVVLSCLMAPGAYVEDRRIRYLHGSHHKQVN